MTHQLCGMRLTKATLHAPQANLQQAQPVVPHMLQIATIHMVVVVRSYLHVGQEREIAMSLTHATDSPLHQTFKVYDCDVFAYYLIGCSGQETTGMLEDAWVSNVVAWTAAWKQGANASLTLKACTAMQLPGPQRKQIERQTTRL
jgi:hypothetical protein